MKSSYDAPLVSIIIPCYNQAHFLGEAIESVLTQILTGYEIVVIDDGSTDHTRAVAANYPNVNYIRQDNQGLAAARNAGLYHSKGDYLVFLDADDRLLPQALEHGFEYLTAHPEWALVAGQYRRITANGSVLPTWREQRLGNGSCFISGNYRLIAPDGAVLDTSKRDQVASDYYAALLQRNYIEMHATVMYRRTALEAVGGFDPSLPACEDYDMYLRIARQFPISCHPHVVADYRQHNANMTRNSARMLTAALRVLNSQWQYVEGNLYYEQAYKRGQKLWRDYYFRQALGETRVYLKSRAWGKASRSAIMPIQYILIKGKESGFKIGGLSKYWLKAAWRRLTRQPVGRLKWGDVRRLTPLDTNLGFQVASIDRYYVECFLKTCQAEIRGNVLEISDGTDPAQLDSLEKTYPRQSEETNHLTRLTAAALLDHTQRLAAAYDCIILPQILQRSYYPGALIQAAYRLLKPGGILLATLPGIGQLQMQDQVNHPQYWSFTAQAARRLFAENFPPINVKVQAFGNVLAAMALLQGVPVSALQPHELDYQDDQYQVLIAVSAVKPAHG